MAVSGLGVAYIAGGLILVTSGMKNQTLAVTLRDLLKGQVPPLNSQQPTIGVTSGGAAAASGNTGSAIADDALRYVGHPYLYGGAPGANGQSPWDCSSFCSWVLGHDLNMVLPGASSPGYSGASHGPTTLSYLAWSGAQTVSNSASAAQAGDLCVWQTHMGIATGNGQMVSAENPQSGTKTDPIAGFIPGEILFVRRIKSTSSPALGGIYPTPTGQAPPQPIGVRP
jgi:cell wall-associated NlpC family hydrolase